MGGGFNIRPAGGMVSGDNGPGQSRDVSLECLVCPQCGVLEGLGDEESEHCPKCGLCSVCGDEL